MVNNLCEKAIYKPENNFATSHQELLSISSPHSILAASTRQILCRISPPSVV